MSRIGRLPIAIPANVEIQKADDTLKIKGPGGEMEQSIPPGIAIEIDNQILRVKQIGDKKATQALFGTIRSLVFNKVLGVTEGFTKELEIIGVGYKARVEGAKLHLNVGFTHPIVYPIPSGIEIKVSGNQILIFGIDKEKVGKVASEIRKNKKCNPYTGKGIKYKDEVIKRKAGKAAKTGSSFGAK